MRGAVLRVPRLAGGLVILTALAGALPGARAAEPATATAAAGAAANPGASADPGLLEFLGSVDSDDAAWRAYLSSPIRQQGGNTQPASMKAPDAKPAGADAPPAAAPPPAAVPAPAPTQAGS